MLLYKRLKDRGWDRKTLEPMFIWAHEEIVSPRKKRKKEEEPVSNRSIVLVHSEYNKFDIQRKKVREIWNDTMELLEKDISEGGLGIKRVIFAYSRPRNLKDLLQRAKLYQNKDHKASSYFLGGQ